MTNKDKRLRNLLSYKKPNYQGYLKCHKCQGKGFVGEPFGNKTFIHLCPKCQGEGKITWTQKMLG